MNDTFRQMRRKRQLLSDGETINILNRCTSGVLALLGDNEYPYALPISYVYDDKCIYFHSAISGHKIDAITSNEKCSFCVIEQDNVIPSEFTTYFRSVIAFGRIHIIHDDASRMKALQILGNHYNPGDDENLRKEIEKGWSHVAVMKMEIDHITGKEAIELVRSRENKE